MYRNITNPFQQITSKMFGGGGEDITTNLLDKQLELVVGVSSAISARLAEHSSIMRVTETLGGKGEIGLFCFVFTSDFNEATSCKMASFTFKFIKVVPLVLEHINSLNYPTRRLPSHVDL